MPPVINQIKTEDDPLSRILLIYSLISRTVKPIYFQNDIRAEAQENVMMKTCLHNFDSLKPHLYIVKLGFTGVYIIFFCSWIVLGFNDKSTIVGHFVSSPREREKSDRRDSGRDEREEEGRKRNRNQSEETEEIKHSLSAFTYYKDSRPCSTVNQNQLGAPVTKDTGHFRTTRPPPYFCSKA